MNNPIIRDNSVLADYVKTGVSVKEWMSRYSQMPAYKLINKSDHLVVMGFLRPRYDEPLPHHLHLCSENDLKKMGVIEDEHTR